MNSRRTTMQIYADILRSIRKSGGKMKKTHIVYKANLTHMRLEKYTEFLLSRNLINEQRMGNQTFFMITDEGARFLEKINKLQKISDAFGIPI